MFKKDSAVPAVSSITEGVIWKQLLFFFFPICLGTFFQQFYNTIDAIVVGRYVGKAALAAVGGSSAQIINLIVGFFTGLTAGASVVISQVFGAKDQKGTEESIHTIYAFSVAGSLLMMALGFFLSPSLLKWMHTPAELMQESILYLRIYFSGIIFVFIYNTGSSIIRALGDSKRPFYYLIVCCLVNVILDLAMVLGLGLGVAGVAIATLAAQAVSACLVTRALMHPDSPCHFSFKKLHIHRRIFHSQLYIGLPAGLQSVMYGLSNIIVQSALNTFGTDTAAAWAAYGKLDAIFWMVSGSFGIAITTFVSQNYGAGKINRIKQSVKICLGMDLIVSIFMTLFLFFLRRPLFHIFNSDTEVVRIGISMLEIIAPCYLVFVFIEIFSGALRGINDVILPMIMTLCGICLFRVLWILLVVPLHKTLITTILNYPVTWIFTALLFIIYYRYRIRRLKPIGEKTE